MTPLRFILTLPLFALPLIGAGWAYVSQVAPERSFGAVAAAVVVNMLTGYLAYYIMHLGLDKGGARFMQYFSVGMGSKMMILLATVLVVLLFAPAVKYEFVAAFAASYFVFTAYEVYGLMKANSQKTPAQPTAQP